VVGKNSDGTIRFTPFYLTNSMKINTFLAMAGMEGTKLNALLAGLTLADIVTSTDGTLANIQINVVHTILDLKVAKVIELFYENASLSALLGSRSFSDLIDVSRDFSRVSVTFDNFFGTMKWVDILAVCNISGEYIDELFGGKTVKTLISISPEFVVTFTPFHMTDSMQINTILAMLGITSDSAESGVALYAAEPGTASFGDKLTTLLHGVTLSDILTSDDGTLKDIQVTVVPTVLDFNVAQVIDLVYENEKLSNLLDDRCFGDLLQVGKDFESFSFGFDTFFGTMRWVDILAVAGMEGVYIEELFGDKTINTLISISPEFAVTFTPFDLTDDMKINTFLAIMGMKDNTKLNNLFADISLGNLVTSDDGTINHIDLPAVQTVLGLSLVQLIGLFYENDALTRLLTSEDGTEKSIATMVKVTGLFESVSLDIDAFVGDMQLMDFVALAGFENAGLADLLGTTAIGDYFSFNDMRLQSIDLTLDGILNFLLSFGNTSLEKLGLEGIVDGVKIGDIFVVAEDGSIRISAEAFHLDIGREFERILENPLCLRSLIFIVGGIGAVVYLWFFENETLMNYAFIPDLLGNTEDANLIAIFDGKTVGDLLGDGFARLHINATKFLAGVPLSVIPGLAKFDNEYLNRMLGDTTFDDIFSVDDEDQFHFRPFALTDPIALTDILGLCGINNEKVNALLDGLTMEDVITSPHKTVYGIRVDAIQTLLALKVAGVIDIFYSDKALSDLLGEKRFDDLLKITGLFEKVEVTFDDFFGDMLLTDIFYAVTHKEGQNLKAVLGDSTVGTVLTISPEFKVGFTPFRLTDNISLNAMLDLAGYKNDKLRTLLDGLTIADFVTSESGGFGDIRVDAIQTITNLRILSIVDLFYENANLTKLLGERRLSDLVQIEGVFKSVTVTFDTFFGDMELRTIVSVFAPHAVSDGKPLARILDDTRIGDIISISSDFKVKCAPFALTDDVYLTDVLDLFGVRNEKVMALLDGIQGSDLITFKGSSLEVGAIETVLNFKVADVISLFFEHEKLNALLGEKRFSDLIQVNGLFESFSITFNTFFGDMQWQKILAIFKVEGTNIADLFGNKTIGDVLSIDNNYTIIFTPFALTDDMEINTFLAIAQVNNNDLTTLLEGKTLADIITSDSKGLDGIRFTVIDTLFGFELKDLVALTGLKHRLVDTICTDGKTIGSFLSIGDNWQVTFNFAGLCGDVLVSDLIDGLLSFINRSLEGWDMTYLFEGLYVTDLIDFHDGAMYEGSAKITQRVTDNMDKILDTIKSAPFSEPSLIYIGAGAVALTVTMIFNRDAIMQADLAALLGFAEDTYLYRLLNGKCLADLIDLSGSDFNSIFTWYDFVADMKFEDILGALRITDERVLKLVGSKTVSTLVQPDGEGSYKITVNDFLGFTKMGDIFGTDKYLELFADFYLIDLYRVIKGSEDILALAANRIGDKYLYDLAKVVLGEHTRVKIALGTLTVDDIIVKNTAGEYVISFAEVKKISFGALFGYTRSVEDGKWYDLNGKRVTGIMSVIADMTYSTFDSGIGDIRIGEILDYTEGEDGKWYDASGVEVTGILTAFAGLTITEMSDTDTLNDAINKVTVKDVMGLTYDEETGKWMKGEEEVSPVIAALADAKIGDLETRINKVELGQVAGFIKGEDGKYYEKDADGNLKPATGVLGEMADLTIEMMKDSGNIIDRIQKVKVGYALGYTYSEGKWYDESGKEPTGIWSTLVDKEIGKLDEAVDDAKIGTLMNYTERDNGDGTTTWVDESGEEVKGYINLIGPDTKISELDARVEYLKNNATIGQFMDADLLEIDQNAQDKLDVLNPDWRDNKLNEFISWMISIVTA